MANFGYGIPKAQLMAGDAMNRALTRMAHEMMEQLDLKNMVFVGIRRRGVPLAQRLADIMRSTSMSSAPWVRWTSPCTAMTVIPLS